MAGPMTVHGGNADVACGHGTEAAERTLTDLSNSHCRPVTTPDRRIGVDDHDYRDPEREFGFKPVTGHCRHSGTRLKVPNDRFELQIKNKAIPIHARLVHSVESGRRTPS